MGINKTGAEPWRDYWEMAATVSTERGWEGRGEVAMVGSCAVPESSGKNNSRRWG